MSVRVSKQQLRDLAAKAGPDSPLHAIAAKMGPRRDLEHPEQVKLFNWRRENALEMPALRLLYAIPNFSGRGASARIRMRDGARLKAEGRRKGMLDTCLPVARGKYHALYLEIKAEGYPSADQKWWIRELTAEGNLALMVRGFEEARAIIIRYLSQTT